MDRVYLDHNATTPLDPRVLEAMLPWLSTRHGNPSSIHAFGQAARQAVEEAREQVASLIGAQPLEIVFTASGTESNNAAIFSCVASGMQGDPGAGGGAGRIVLTGFEHPSVVQAAARLAGRGVEVVEVPVGVDGIVDVAAFVGSLGDETRIACLMLANNEVGTLQPVAEVAAECRRRGVPLLCDAVQAIGKIPVDVARLGADFVSLGGHKFNGPQGMGALWVRAGMELDSLLVGGGQERHRRAGTENVPGIVGLGAAASVAASDLESREAYLQALRDRFENGLEAIGRVTIHCAASPRLPNTSNVAIHGVAAETLVIRLDLRGFAVSAGSACAAGAAQPSRTLRLLGLSDREALSSLRVSVGATNTPAEVDAFLAVLSEEVSSLCGGGRSPESSAPVAGGRR